MRRRDLRLSPSYLTGCPLKTRRILGLTVLGLLVSPRSWYRNSRWTTHLGCETLRRPGRLAWMGGVDVAPGKWRELSVEDSQI